MLRKLVTGLMLVPLAILFVAFAVANRHSVVLTLDPFDQVHPALALAVPLFALLLGVAIGGVVLGGAAAWMRQAKWRRAARLAQTQARALAAELDRLKEQVHEPGRSGSPVPLSGYQPRLTIPPPAA
ncbi:MAG TPA: LapA family protein [Xanthobacteraceae bacterium]|jgi:uncharacterized integral membrane protein